VRHEMVQQRLDSLDEIGAGDLMDIMSWHFEGTEYDLSNGYASSPHTMPGVRSICRTNTQVSEVTQLRGWLPAPIGAVVWTSMRTPCSGVYVPWYMGITDVPAPYKTGTDEVSEGSAWWAFRDLDAYVNSHYKDTIPTVRDTWQPFQAQMLADQAAFERAVLKLYKKDSRAAKAMLTAYSGELGMQAYETAGSLLEQLTAEE
jgi:dipeptidase